MPLPEPSILVRRAAARLIHRAFQAAEHGDVVKYQTSQGTEPDSFQSGYRHWIGQQPLLGRGCTPAHRAISADADARATRVHRKDGRLGACDAALPAAGRGRHRRRLCRCWRHDALASDFRLGTLAAKVAILFRLAQSLAYGPTFAHGMTKTMLNQEWAMTTEQAIEAEAQAQPICLQTRDFERACRVLVDKRKPRFEGD